MTDSPPIPLPPILRSQWEQPAPSRGPSFTTILLAFGGIFVWAPFYDGLWVGVLGQTNFTGLAGFAFVAAALCFSVFYVPTIAWGHSAQQRLCVTAGSTFGTAGSEWVTGIGLALAGLYWYAASIDFALDTTMLGFQSMGLLERTAWANVVVSGLSIRPLVFVLSALFWIFIIRTAFTLGLTSVIIALMKFYTPVALGLLTVIACVMIPRFLDFHNRDVDLIAPNTQAHAAIASRMIFDRILGFFTVVGLLSVDWGTTARGKSNMILGGLTGIVGVATWTSAMALITIAGTVAGLTRAGTFHADDSGGPAPLSFRWAILYGIGGPLGGTILILFGLATLGAACYMVDLFARRMMAHWPLRKRWLWAWIAGMVALAVITFGGSRSIDRVESVMSFALSPILGAIVADVWSQRGRWAGVRQGWYAPGFVAILAGFLLEAIVIAYESVLPTAISAIPHSMIGFAAAAAVFVLPSLTGRLEPAIALRPPVRPPQVYNELTTFNEQPIA